MRIAEIIIAATLMALSVFFMTYAAELPIGWQPGAGPGGGAFPFWLGLMMLIASTTVLVRELRTARRVWRASTGVDEGGGARQNAEVSDGEADTPFITKEALLDVACAAGLLIGCVALIGWVGAYVSIPLFMIAYLQIFGRHSWLLTSIMAVSTPVFMFFFFEVTLKILLPKGLTEPLFIPLYAIFF